MRDGFIPGEAHRAEHIFGGLYDHRELSRNIARSVNKQSCLAFLNFNRANRVKGYNSIPFTSTPIVSTNVEIVPSLIRVTEPALGPTVISHHLLGADMARGA